MRIADGKDSIADCLAMSLARRAAVVFLDLAIFCKPIQKSFSNENVFLRPLMTSDRLIEADFFMPLLIANAKRADLARDQN